MKERPITMKEKKIEDYIHLYLGCHVCREHSETRSDKFFEYGKLVGVSASEIEEGKTVAILDVGLDHFHEWYVEETKLLLRPLSSMTEEIFQELAKRFFNDPNLVFCYDGSYWYACTSELDPEYDGEIIEHINEACDDDPENVLVCCKQSKTITYGWIEYDERYHGMSTQEQAEIFRLLISEDFCFDLFELIPAKLALDKTLVKN